MNEQIGRTVIVNCAWKCCKKEFSARVADRKRGWAKFCSKSCKAKDQEKRTHQNANYHDRKELQSDSWIDDNNDLKIFDQFDNEGEGQGWDAHKDC